MILKKKHFVKLLCICMKNKQVVAVEIFQSRKLKIVFSSW